LSQFESPFEENLYNERREKLAKIIALGQSAYPNQFLFSPQDIDVPKIKADYAYATGEELEAARPQFAVAGRLIAIRLQGKACSISATMSALLGTCSARAPTSSHCRCRR
jgi:lysyl-tRNA synthetase class 2